MEIVIVLALLVAAIVLFATDRLSVDIVTLLVLIGLILSGIISPEEAYRGFGSDFIVMLAAIFVIGAAIEENGILDALGTRAVEKLGGRPIVVLTGVMIIAIVLSAFMNNTTLTALLIAPVVSISRHMQVSPSKFLMPLAFASLMGGTCTLIGTSTNIAGSAYMDQAGLEPISMFELMPLGAILCAVGIVYMIVIGKWLLPERAVGSENAAKERYYLSQLIVLENSPMIGQTIYETDLYKKEFKIHHLTRGNTAKKPDADLKIQEGDKLFVEGNVKELLELRDREGINIVSEKLEDDEFKSEETFIAEVLINKNSRLVNQTLQGNQFKKQWGAIALALHRPGKKQVRELKNTHLQMGDILLIQGAQENIDQLTSALHLILIDQMPNRRHTTRRGWATFAFFGIAIALSSLDVLPVSVAFMAAAVLSVIIKAIDTQTAYRAIEWRLLVLIGGMTAFGAAMKNSGTDVFLAEMISGAFQSYGPAAVLASFMLLTVLLTQPMSNAAAALVVLPVAIQTAQTMGAEPRSFAIAVVVSGSISMITPFEPACILVYGPGKYKFYDFIKVGGLLTLILLVIIWWLVPVFWPL